MPSYAWQGLSEGIAPFAKSLFDSQIRMREERSRPEYGIRVGLADAIRSLQAAPTTANLQTGADLAEHTATPGSRLDLNQVISSLSRGASPGQVQQANQGQGLIDTLRKAGFAGIGAEGGVTFKQPDVFSQILAKQYGLTPEGGTGTGSGLDTSNFIPERVKAGGLTLVNPEAIGEREQAAAQAKQNVKNKDLMRQFSLVQKDLDSVLQPLSKVPAGRVAGTVAAGKAIVGAKGSENVFDYENSKELILAKISKTFGGEVGVLTDSDIARIGKAFPPLWMNPRERAARIKWVKDYIQRRITEYSDTDGFGESEAQGDPLGLR